MIFLMTEAVLPPDLAVPLGCGTGFVWLERTLADHLDSRILEAVDITIFLLHQGNEVG